MVAVNVVRARIVIIKLRKCVRITANCENDGKIDSRVAARIGSPHPRKKVSSFLYLSHFARRERHCWYRNLSTLTELC